MSMNTRPRVIRNEHGVALVLALFLVTIMSVLAASLMFLSQTETYSTQNYRMMSQARYGAEAGVQKAGNFLFDTTQYAKPGTVAGDAAPPGSRLTATTILLQAPMNTAVNTPRATRSAVMGFIAR